MAERLPFAVHYEVDHLYTALVAVLTERGVNPYAAEDAAYEARIDVENAVRRALAIHTPATEAQ